MSQPARVQPILGFVLASAAYVLEIALTPLILPEIQGKLGLTVGQVALIVNAYGMAVAVSVLLGGWLGDRFGPIRIFAVGTLLFCAGSAFVALSSTLSEMMAARLVQGLGAGLFSPVIPVLLARNAGERPGRLLALWYSFSGLLVALAPVLAAPLVMLFGWRAVFCLIAAVIVPALALVTGSSRGAPACEPQRGRVMHRLLGERRCTMLFAYVALNYGSVMLFLFIAPLSLAATPATAGLIPLILGGFWAAFTLTGIATRNMVDGGYSGAFLVLSPVILFGGFLLFLLGPTPVLQLPAALAVGAAFALGNTPATTLILRHAPGGSAALAASVDITFARIGQALAIAAIGPLAAVGQVAAIAAVSAVSLIFAFGTIRLGGARQLAR
jgi:MFS family permease